LSETMLARNRELYPICIREFIAYRPRRFAGRISIFRTADFRFDMCDPVPIWKRLTDGVDVFTVAGSHGTIMEKRNVGSVARQLSRCLAGEEAWRANEREDETNAVRPIASPVNDQPQAAPT